MGREEERVRAMMKDMATGRDNASQILGYNPDTKRLEVTSPYGTKGKDLIRITPEDMRVSACSFPRVG